MLPKEVATIGIPSFFIALQANYAKPAGRMLFNILEHTLPAAITVIFNTLYIQLAAVLFDIPLAEYSTMVVFLVGIVAFYLLAHLAKPFTKFTLLMFITMVTCFVMSFLLLGDFLSLTSMISRNAFFFLPLIYFSYHIHGFLGKVCRRSLDAYRILRDAGWTRENNG
jgi:cation-transporting ATPase E